MAHLHPTPVLEPGAPSDLELMHGIQAEDPEALSALYDRYNGIIKALILRVVHNEAEADDLLQEIFMELWNQAKNFSPQKGKPLGWMVTLARRRAIDGLRKKQAYMRAGERLQHETEQQPDAWVHNTTEEEINFSDTRVLIRKVINSLPPDLKHWYTQPAGLVQSRSGDLLLPGTESMCGGEAPADDGAGGGDKKKKR